MTTYPRFITTEQLTNIFANETPHLDIFKRDDADDFASAVDHRGHKCRSKLQLSIGAVLAARTQLDNAFESHLS
ncbi:hypothetical protein F443_04578 [Phytophthora nicotianae P1569]|uniref:Uncharacterized protein n=1 Tax=Phytophthora nicotianae P1569 TaxID=1317065 RepID=V9FLC1_PHYNI|nr:hypothetical protein F443_04578 [Phytophthora nicotianae P1569]